MAAITMRQVTKSFGPVHVIKGVDLDDRAQRVRGLRRPLRLRQVHAAAPDRRPRGHHLGRADDRQRDRQRPAAVRARHLDGVPVLRALPAHDRQGQHGLRPQAREGRPQGRRGAGPERRPHPADRPTCSTASPSSSPAASASASPSAAPSSATRASSCSTSRSPTSTPACASRCASRSPSCTTSLDATMIYVTHDQVEAMTLADRIVVLDAGNVRQFGAPLELYQHPAQQVRRRLHRQPEDELPPLHRRRRRARPPAQRRRPRRRSPTAAPGPPSSASAPSTSAPTAPATPRSRARSSPSSAWVPRATCTSTSARRSRWW